MENPTRYLAATTGIGIRAWFEAAQSWGLGDALTGALGGVRMVAWGPKAAGAVQAAGLPVWRSAANEQMDQVLGHLLAEDLDCLLAARRTVAMVGVDVVLQGLVALVGEERVRLNFREQACSTPSRPLGQRRLPAHPAAPGVVVDRGRPARVEVALARLRPRLEPAGTALVAPEGTGRPPPAPISLPPPTATPAPCF